MTQLQRRIKRGRPLRCRHVAKVLQAVLDGEADGLTAEAVQTHLDACRDCGMEAELYEEIRSSLGRSAPLVPPAAIERLRAFSADLANLRDD